MQWYDMTYSTFLNQNYVLFWDLYLIMFGIYDIIQFMLNDTEVTENYEFVLNEDVHVNCGGNVSLLLSCQHPLHVIYLTLTKDLFDLL